MKRGDMSSVSPEIQLFDVLPRDYMNPSTMNISMESSSSALFVEKVRSKKKKQ
jgi:hypothetical protein